MSSPQSQSALPSHENAPVHAPLQEIFSSIQGEGIHVGKRQIFTRFAHCHLKCAYCDTPMASPTGQCHFFHKAWSDQFVLLENPMHPEALMEAIQQLLPQAHHHSISFTGGEPLLYHRFLQEVLPVLQPQCPIYLETSGTQPEFLQAVLPWVDILAMDIKLPSATGEAPQFENHAEFYRVAHTRPKTALFIKLIFTPETSAEELDAVRDIVCDPATPIILQPMTSLTDNTVHLPPAELFRIEQQLSAFFTDVRVIPQTHKMLKVQ